MNQPEKYNSFNFSLKFSLKKLIPVLVLFGALCAVGIGVLGSFLFGGKLLLFSDIGSDTYYSYYTFYYLLTDYISNGTLPFWSFKIGAGSSLLTLYQFLYDPFSVVYYLIGVGKISRSIAWIFILKSCCAAIFTYLYLRYLGIGLYARIIASLLFAFNGFLMVWGQHFFFGSWVIFLPLLLLTIEIWICKNKWLPMVLCVSYMALNIAIFFQVTIFCVLYVLFRLGMEWQKDTKLDLAIRLLKFGGIYALGLGVSAVLWLPEYYLLKSNPRISVDFFHALAEIISNFAHLNTPDYYWSMLSRIFSNNLQGVGSEYKGFMNYYESIQLYVGVLPLLVLPQFYCVFSSRAKWAASLALLIAVSFLVFPSFSQVMNGFQYPSYRWGYIIIMLELLLAALVLDLMCKQQKINISVLISTGFVLFLCVAFLSLKSSGLELSIYKNSVVKSFEVVAIIVCYSMLLYLLVVGSQHRRWVFMCLLFFICCELILEHRDSFVKRSVFTKGIEQNRNINFFDYGSEAAHRLKLADQTVYRIEKNHWILSLSDSLIQNYYGLDAYNSLNTPSYQSFLKEFGYPGSSNVIKWNSLDHPYLADILSVKYHLTKNIDKKPQNMTYKDKVGDVFIYERNSFLPFGFTYDSYFTPSVYNQLGEDRERALLQGVVLDEDLVRGLTEVKQIKSMQDDDSATTALRENVLNVAEMHEDKVTGTLHLDRAKLLFLSIPYDRGWTAYVNGKESDIYKVNFGFTGLYLEQGDNRVELRFFPPYMKAGAAISLLCILLSILIAVLEVRTKKNIAV